MTRFTVAELPLVGLRRVGRRRLQDARGFLSRLFCAEELLAAGWRENVAQVNHVRTNRSGTVRGMHYQNPPHAEKKLVSCIRGEVWDVAVDLRKGSATFLQWHAELLSADNGHALLIPEGFAHGVQTLSDDVELIYCHSVAYCATAEGKLNPLDPALAITWPAPISELSEQDASAPMVSGGFMGIAL